MIKRVQNLIWYCHGAEDLTESEDYGVDEALPPTWRYFSEYPGEAIPEKIIKEMKEAQGSVVEWDKRGVEVGNQAWAVLSLFMAELAAIKQKELEMYGCE